jgi:hypothetical protein
MITTGKRLVFCGCGIGIGGIDGASINNPQILKK